MTDYIKDLHTPIFNSTTGCGRSQLVLNLREKDHYYLHNALME